MLWRSAASCAVAAALSGVTAAAQPLTTTPTADATSTSIPFPVVGVDTGINKRTGQPPSRLNINSLWAHGGPQWDLYILALAELQKTKETDETSYFAIAGIHGLPHSAWNGVGHVDGAPISGFCPHGELLFTIWHRPYVALFEQLLVSRAMAIALRYPDELKPEYVAAAETLRQPFWDWAANSTLPPGSITVNLTVRAPEGNREIPNPLYSYRYQRPNVEKKWGGDLSKHPYTYRCLGSNETAINNATASNEGLLSAATSLTSNIYDIFARIKTFDDMQSTSFENPHNVVHFQSACGTGTMADINWAAFEPLFMLHHANIDRLLAMWQTINYHNAMFNGTSISGGQFGTPKNTIITADSPLKPFFMADNVTFHTSKSVSNISVFGYTYPELPDFYLPLESRASHVRAQVNHLYGPATNSRVAQPGTLTKFGKTGIMNYYTVGVELERNELGGGGGASVGLWLVGNKVGEVTVLGAPCDGFLSQWIPLGDVRVNDNSSLFDFQPEKVVAFVQWGLEVEIRLADGTQIAVGNMPSLKLTLQTSEYMPRMANQTDGFPEFNGEVASWAVEVKGKDETGYNH